MRDIQTHVKIFFILVIIVTASTRAQNSSHYGNNHDLSIAIEEMEKANYFSFVMLINMLQNSTDPSLLSDITFLMPKDKTLSRSNIIQQDSISEFLLRHSIPSPLLFEHLNLIPNGSIVPSSLPHYNLKITNGGRLNYFVNNVKIISRNICTLGSIKCHGIDGVLPSPSAVNDDSPRDDHTSPFISCPSSHNNSEHDSPRNTSSEHDSSRPDDHTHHVAPSPTTSPTPAPKSDSSMIGEGNTSGFVVLLGLLSCVMGMGMAM